MTPEKAAEAAETALIFHAALTMLGFKTLANAIELWADVNTGDVSSSSARWITRALNLVGIRRRQARRIAVTFYRLTRALQTGYTVHDPLATSEQRPIRVSLHDLRADFYDTVEELTPEIYGDQPQNIPGAHAATEEDFDEVPDPGPVPPDEEIEVESLDGDPDWDALDDEADSATRLDLTYLGPINLAGKLEKVDDNDPAVDVDQVRGEAHEDAGNRQAASAERNAVNGGRQAIQAMAAKDHRVVAYARVSRTGTPCAWCAMLISRGAVYKTRQSAERGEDGDGYHDNCHCYAEPIFSVEHYDRDPRFDLNREYSELWARAMGEDDSDDEALTVWRRFWRNHQEQQAQAA